MQVIGIAARASKALFLLGFVLFAAVPGIGWSLESQCGALDDNGSGIIDLADARPLIEDYLLLSDCMGSRFAIEASCEPFDLKPDRSIDSGDFSLVTSMYDAYLECADSDIADRVDCMSLDLDGDGHVDQRDLVLIGEIADGVLACFGANLGVLRCVPVDYDEDAAISSVDEDLFEDQWMTLKGCLGEVVADSGGGLWIDRDRLMALPTHGAAWDRVHAAATAPYRDPDLADQNDPTNVEVLAKALVGVRLGDSALIGEARDALASVSHDDSETGANALAVSRELVAYVLAADIVELATLDPALDEDFRRKLRTLREQDLSGRTIVSTHEDRPNNWGTHASATRIAIDLYLDDREDLAAAVEVHRAWLGEGSSHSDFRFGSLSWQADESRPVGINPRAATRSGIDVDGAQPEEMRRGGGLADPPGHTGYPWEALQGATVAAELLSRHGYPDAWHWGDDALRRAVDFLWRLDLRHGGWWAEGDDRWIVWLVNHGVGSDYPTWSGVTAGKNVGFTDWTHSD